MITPRLNTICQKVTSKRIADIGTDHAYIPIQLAKEDKIDFAVASDIRSGPLNIARMNVEKHNLCGKIDLRLGAGLTPVKEHETDEIIIAGMGGQLISGIIGESINKAKLASSLILQPMNAQDYLRKFLKENGFIITDEDLALEGFKVYNIIVCRICNAQESQYIPEYSEIEYHIPKCLYRNIYFPQFIQKKHREFLNIVIGLEKSSDCDEKAVSYYRPLLKQTELIMRNMDIMF